MNAKLIAGYITLSNLKQYFGSDTLSPEYRIISQCINVIVDEMTFSELVLAQDTAYELRDAFRYYFADEGKVNNA